MLFPGAPGPLHDLISSSITRRMCCSFRLAPGRFYWPIQTLADWLICLLVRPRTWARTRTYGQYPEKCCCVVEGWPDFQGLGGGARYAVDFA